MAKEKRLRNNPNPPKTPEAQRKWDKHNLKVR